MPAPDVTSHLVTGFSEILHVEAQQNKARLKELVKIKSMGQADDWAYDSMGEVTSKEEAGKHQDIIFDSVNHTRRQIARQRFYTAIPIDGYDKLGMLLDPNSEYAARIISEMNRRLDRVVMAAAFADVQTGRNFGTTVTAADDGVITVDASAGLTYEKLLEIDQNFMDNEVGNEMPVMKGLTITGAEHSALMKESELTSGDFSRQYAVDKNGGLSVAAGFNLVKYGANATNPILPVNGSLRDCMAIAKGGVCVGISKDWNILIEKRTDKLDTYQVVCSYILGAVRTEGKLIQKVNTTVV